MGLSLEQLILQKKQLQEYETMLSASYNNQEDEEGNSSPNDQFS